MPKKTRIADIAAAANVSNSTVSRILNNTASVDQDTRKRVIDVMKELGYPYVSHKLKKDISNASIIIMLLPSISNPFYNSIAKGVQNVASRHGYNVLVSCLNLSGNSINDLIGIIRNNSVVGVITLCALTNAQLERLARETKVVQCCEFVENTSYSYVSIDDYKATQNALEYLYFLGRRKIAFINGPTHFKYARERQRSYVDFLSRYDCMVKKDWMIQLPDIDYALAAAAASHLLSNVDRPDAVFAVSDIFASAVVKSANQLKISVPKELMVIGFDNVDVSLTTTPSITTINQPKKQLGLLACEILIDHINNPHQEPKQVLLDTELIIREST